MYSRFSEAVLNKYIGDRLINEFKRTADDIEIYDYSYIKYNYAIKKS